MPDGNGFLNNLRRWFLAPPEAGLVCEVASDYVAAVKHERGRAESWAVRSLPPGAVQPAPLGDNVTNSGAVQEALEHVIGAVGDGARRCVLLVPDLVARVVVLEFDRLPEKAEEVDALLRWRLSRDLPFDVRQATLSYQVQPGHGGVPEAMVAVAAHTPLRQYEECVERLGLEPGWVTLSTLAALGWLGQAETPRLLVKRASDSLGLALAHRSAVRLFRSLPLAAASGSTSEAALFEKIYPAAVYFQEQWGEPVSEVVLAGVGKEGKGLAQQIQRETGCRVTELDLASSDLPPSPISGAAPDDRLTASLGWVRGGAG
ncbi:MAG: hypothetical protein HYY26_02600 [Acidobacteria bacterium]|nr:hypothetical protein [Acidobacteriota bacterium]